MRSKIKNANNKLVIGLGFLLGVSVLLLGYVSDNTVDIYKTVEKVKYDEVLNAEKPTIYYYYQDTCHFCNSIKGELTKFNDKVINNDEINFKLVDMKSPSNSNAWYDWDAHNKKYGKDTPASKNPNYISDPSKMKAVDDIKITGTPTMIYVKNQKVVDYQVGKDVFKILNQAIKDANLDLKLDESVYGKA